MNIKIPNFEPFPESNISGRFLINPYWLEHLLNLFFQGYIAEIQMEIWDTKKNMIENIEKTAYQNLANGIVQRTQIK
jgi:hypothetical protein